MESELHAILPIPKECIFMLTRVTYGGWANNIQLSNGQIELVATLDVGPRILRLAFADGPNVFRNFAEQMGKTGEPDFQSRGGHRLWHAPEVFPRTYYPDNTPVTLEQLDEFAVRLTPPEEVENGIQKQLDIRMAADTNQVTVTNRLTNTGRWPISTAAWALSVMDLGGTAIIPLPEKRPHTEALLPEFPLVLWAYTDLADSRFHLGSRYITFAQDPTKGSMKLGLANRLGWAGYLVHGTLFVKYFDYLPDMPYPDMGCNCEVFSNEEILEVETLSPTTTLEPGETLEHTETWRIFQQIPALTDEESIERIVRPLVEKA